MFSQGMRQRKRRLHIAPVPTAEIRACILASVFSCGAIALLAGKLHGSGLPLVCSL